LRTSGDVHLRAFERAHLNMQPSLHAGAASDSLDAGALIYAANRLPAVIGSVQRVVIGQLPEQFEQALGWRLEEWSAVQAPARRRIWHYDGRSTLAVHVASVSDIDDVIPTLVAYQIEWNKLHALLQNSGSNFALYETGEPDEQAATGLQQHLGVSIDDWQRLRRALGVRFWGTLRQIGASKKDFAIRLLGGTHVGY